MRIAHDSPVYLTKGKYLLRLKQQDYADGTVEYRWSNLSQAQRISLGEAVKQDSAHLATARTYRFSVQAGEKIRFNALGIGNGAIPSWRIYNSAGQKIASGNAHEDSENINVLADDDYFIIFDRHYDGNNSSDFQIDRITPSKIATVGLNDKISGTLTPAAQQAEYRLEVEKETVVLLDDLVRTGSNVYWYLEDWHSGRKIIGNNSVSDASASQILSAGSYRLVVYTDEEAVKNYGLRLLDLSSATSVDSTQIIEGRLKNV